MKFVVDKMLFERALSEVSKALPTRTTLPILNNLLFEVKDGELYISATNLDFSIRSWIPVYDSENGAFTLPGKLILNIVQTLPPITITFEHSSGATRMKTDRGEYTLTGLDPEDFPSFKTFDETEGISVSTEALIRGSNYISFCAAKEDPRAFLTGVLLDFRENELRLVATDSHKLGLWKMTQESSLTTQAIVPRHTFEYLKSKDEETVNVRFSKDSLGMFFKDSFLVTRQIEGPYPPYDDIIPGESDNVAIITREELLSALRRLSLFTPSPTYLLRINFSSNGLRLFASSPDVGEGDEMVDATYQGDTIELAFNAQYLLEIIRKLDVEQIRISIYNPSTAIKIEPVGFKENEELLYLLMPIKLD